jgi:hypothetical protein
MKIGKSLATTLLALATLPLLAQQQNPASQPPESPSMQQNPSGTQSMSSPDSPAASPRAAAATVEMIPVNGELMSKLDSKTAKAGDNVVVQTRTSAKTAEGTEIPKGSKLIGHVVGVQPSANGQTSQVALLLDHVELKGGQSVPIHSQIQSITPAGGAAESSSMSSPRAGYSNPSAGGTAGSNPNSPSQQTATAPTTAPAESGPPAAGTVVAKTGNIDIRTTSVPGVLLANNAPGQQDPRMTRTSSILLGAKQDVQLESGTQMVVGVAATGGGTQ